MARMKYAMSERMLTRKSVMTGNAEMKSFPEKMASAPKGRCSPMMKSAIGAGGEIISTGPEQSAHFFREISISIFEYSGSTPFMAICFDQYI
jgi:hypothetical protein